MKEDVRSQEGINAPDRDEIVTEVAEEADDEAEKLREENERLRAEIERVRKLPMKERLYDHVNVSLKTIDIFIAVMAVLGIAAIVVGMMK